jgi:hypothetical protein
MRIKCSRLIKKDEYKWFMDPCDYGVVKDNKFIDLIIYKLNYSYP